ncbi:50S ribosomal protein L21 [Vitellibacter sp. q18]|nr:50S ribosomal protein L21 [Aequorivita lutea]
MYAIVEIAGQQIKVAKDQKVFVNRLSVEEGKKVSFDNVLLIGDGDKITIGAPAIDGAQIGAKVVKHLKGDKVIVFKKKRRKGFRKKNGHRQYLSEIVIESIVASGATPAKKEETKKAAPKAKAEPKAPAAKAAPKKTEKADDLKKIEGVGPKAAEAMVAAGMDTFAKVAKAKPEAIATILSDASPNLAHLVTDTWPKQAQLAADGKWDELKELQDNLNGGIEK